ncbi:MAG: bifunctional demethylmenaquinone methyltransferase/2-methoxy-6-polyprenyl-1,4-benzoquinol methylase UbiE [Gammaproteobacteria bacterium]|jgi:demethylmenaquinone methyltransferase/2-methoxy-6-polyprenyl-1,4-benzoquinol methylase|nr:bifunctional demethylmenaquinone methyltransferase/2-methoxy-6-polyprenyl-1,4-benzoquinol methylase UbiE [Gammaproteobacteria bacterium]|tara:strand:+ start:859 stop:1593 length:735 start_codon:yes stop_codon:yes gene_type:complete
MNKKTHFGFKEVEASKKADHVGEVFHSVAEEYDLMNDVMSLGMHRAWKQMLIELSELAEGSMALDIASGTADIPKLITEKFKSVSVHVTDINESMLSLGRERSINENFFQNCSFTLASGESLPYKDDTFDLVSVGFGLRNFTNKEQGLKEMKRVLKPGGVLLILEFSKPTNSIFSKIYDWYSFNIIPKLGSLLVNDAESYQYLAESIRMHPDQETLKNMVLDSGFKKCKFYNLVNGVVAIHQAK